MRPVFSGNLTQGKKYASGVTRRLVTAVSETQPADVVGHGALTAVLDTHPAGVLMESTGMVHTEPNSLSTTLT